MLLSGIRNASFSMRLLHSKRVISPHLSIYKPQITWILSIGHRITGAFVGGVLYSTAIAYTINPQKTTQFITLLTASKTRSNIHEKLSLRNVTKLILSAPIIFHTFNGIRHLVWDLGFGFGINQVKRTGWSVVILTAISTLYVSLR